MDGELLPKGDWKWQLSLLPLCGAMQNQREILPLKQAQAKKNTPVAQGANGVHSLLMVRLRTPRLRELSWKSFAFVTGISTLGDFITFRHTASDEKTEKPKHPDVHPDRARAGGPECGVPFICNIHPPAGPSPHPSPLPTQAAFLIFVTCLVPMGNWGCNPGLNRCWLNWRLYWKLSEW